MVSNSVSLLLLLMTAVAAVLGGISPARVSVIEDSDNGYLAFAINDKFGLYYYTSSDGSTWIMGKQIDNGVVPIVSNPVAVTMYDLVLKTNVVYVFAQGGDGQVYCFTKSTTSLEFKQQKLTSDLPAAKFSANVHHIDALKALYHNNLTYVFVRSQTNCSQLFWKPYNSSLIPIHPKWTQINGGGLCLSYDPFIALNTYSGIVEVFATLSNARMYHTWQTAKTDFKNSWTNVGGPSSPTFNSAPVVEQMSHSVFNGVLNLFARGYDNHLHHVWQTTCTVTGCTWGLFYKVGGPTPSDNNVLNALSISRNIHLGVEVFTIGEKDGHLYHIWQAERDGSWSDWESLGPLSSGAFDSQPTLVTDKNGWWQAFAFDKYPQSLARYEQKPLSFSLTPSEVEFDHNVTVSWAIPVDEATHKDWIGVYPKGAEVHQYIDFAYVGGTQNPLKDPVPQGAVNFTASLPNGIYEYKYMVNKQYIPVLDTSATVVHATTDLEWVQIYKGIARGLGGINENITECVEDGNRTIETFRDAFTEFENRHIFEGLHLFAQGLSDIRDTLVQCDETVIVDNLSKFVSDLISCTEGSCVKFLLDIAVEILILYEHEYEIYGDIQAANNCFKIDAYQQGGVCIGRVTNACLTRM